MDTYLGFFFGSFSYFHLSVFYDTRTGDTPGAKHKSVVACSTFFFAVGLLCKVDRVVWGLGACNVIGINMYSFILGCIRGW